MITYPISTPVLPDKEKLSRRYNFKYGVIPKGFTWNGASIPRAFWTTTGSPFWPQFRRAGLVHDYLYETHLTDRKTADRIFRNILKEDGVGRYTRNKMYWAVRSCGWKAWK